uniref:Gastrin/cholecystokinin peptide hormone domain-containing protein n=1 Tax=Paramormyrops kingsleyae TaxID=1676925 RepID=A0A3B3QN94_9TELE
MTGKGVYVCAVAAAILATCFTMAPLGSEHPEVQGPAMQLEKTLTAEDAILKAVDRVTRQGKMLQTAVEGYDRLGSMMEDQRDFMSKQILQTIIEHMNKGGCFGDHPFSNRDYQGWMDFGRRSSEKQEQH